MKKETKIKEHAFLFSGTKEDFFNRLNHFYYSAYGDKKSYDMGEYLIESVNGELRFGVERTDHSGGYWFIPTITEKENQTEFCGRIQYIASEIQEDTRDVFKKITDTIFETVGMILLFIFLLPLLLIYQLYCFGEFLIRKICKLPLRPRNTEERLNDLMENRLGCVRK